jgi:hypothetical protein
MELGQDFCRRSSTAIVSAEHLAAGALAVVSESLPGIPTLPDLEQALLMAQSEGDAPLTQQVMWGSSARDAMTATAALVRRAGGGAIDARTLAYVTIASDELRPMFFDAIGIPKSTLLALLART